MADSELADLTVKASPAADDLLYLVDEDGSPVDRKTTVAGVVSAANVAAAGAAMLATGGTFAADISVPGEVYGAGWNGSTEVPTKNDVYDKIESMGVTVVCTGTGNNATTTTMAAVDATNLPFIGALNLQVGERVIGTLTAQIYSTSSVGNLWLDMEVDRPTSGDVMSHASRGPGAAWVDVSVTGNRETRTFQIAYTATEAGLHSFRPAWKHTAAGITMANASSGNDDTDIIWSVEKVT